MKNQIRAFAPATVGNVGVGFDVLGFALQSPGDTVDLLLNNSGKVTIREITGDGGELPKDPALNTVSLVVMHYLKHIQSPVGVEITLHKGLPLKSGMGSSAASSVAGVFACNELLGRPLPKEDLLQFAVLGEQLACGAPHADNVAPCLHGGFVLSRGLENPEAVPLPTPPELFYAIVHPHIALETRQSRAVLPTHIPLSTAVQQWGNLAAFVAALHSNNYDLLSRSLVDLVAEPARAHLIPGFQQAKLAALDSSALACSISGSGPTIFALCKGYQNAEKVALSFEKVYKSLQIPASVYFDKVNTTGPQIL